MTNSADEKSFLKKSEEKIIRPNWLFEIEPYSRTYGESLTDLRDNIKLKKIVRRAIERDFAPAALIQRIQTGIRA
jgi:hypothetical protein